MVKVVSVSGLTEEHKGEEMFGWALCFGLDEADLEDRRKWKEQRKWLKRKKRMAQQKLEVVNRHKEIG